LIKLAQFCGLKPQAELTSSLISFRHPRKSGDSLFLKSHRADFLFSSDISEENLDPESHNSEPVHNTSVNPARSTGPALFAGGPSLGQLWLFWLSPLKRADAKMLTYY
jgi:hypothetical protein